MLELMGFVIVVATIVGSIVTIMYFKQKWFPSRRGF